MKKLLIAVFFLSTMLSFGQNTVYQDSNANAEKKAKDLAYKYDKQLGLTEKQLLSMEKKIEEFLIKEMKIRESKMSVENKIMALKQNWATESADMTDILTQPQFDLYKKLKVDYQPIDGVVVKDADREPMDDQ